MYKNRKYRIASDNNDNQRPAAASLNSIAEDASIKIARKEGAVNASPVDERMPINDENILAIPCSQEPTQRYLSQRSNIAATLTRTQSRIGSSQRTANSYFELVLMRAGVLLDEGDNFVLSCDHIAFVNRLRDMLVNGHNYPENVETFKTGMRAALSNKTMITQKLLTGCTVNSASADNVYQSQDSMLVNFLMIDFLRDHVLHVLLGKISELAAERTLRHTTGNLPMLPLLLTQLRYLRSSHAELIYERMSSTFRNASECAMWEIIAHAEYMLESSKHDGFAQLLLDKLVTSQEFFHATTIQSLISLSLSAPMQRKLGCKMLAYIKEDRCPPALLPVLVKFLLKIINEDNDDSVQMLVTSLRQILINQVGKNGVEERQIQLDLIGCIEQGLKRSRKLYQQWQKTIAGLPAHSFRPIDFLTLVLLVHIREDNSLYIGNMLRRRIKSETITVKMLKETKERYGALLEEHIATVMQILHDFLRERHAVVMHFARDAYAVLFQICNNVQREIVSKLLELTCDKSAPSTTTLALNMLRALQHEYPKEMQNWDMLLLPLLDRLHEMTFSQTRLIMEILCSIAYPMPSLPECAALQEQIDMVVKKQIICCTPYVKKQGIIGSVQLIDSIARIATTIQTDDCNATINSVSDLPDGRAQIAANHIIRVQACRPAEALALFYDELAGIVATQLRMDANRRYYDKDFLAWLCDNMTANFQSNFICEEVPRINHRGGPELCYQKCINSRADTSTDDLHGELLTVAINIAGLVLEPPSAEASTSIVVLAALFRLVRYLHALRNEGSLEPINALLGCAIVLPRGFDDTNADVVFYEHGERMQRQVLDIYYHCANWMRETVSAFVTQRCDGLRRKVLLRLGELIDVERTVRKLLTRAPLDYTPPMSRFIDDASSRGQPAKAARRAKDGNKTAAALGESDALLDETHNPMATRLAAAGGRGGNNKNKNSASTKEFETLYGPKERYRQLDSDIMHILCEKLSLHYPLSIEERGEKIGLLELRFVMSDLVVKLESVTGTIVDTDETLQYIAKPHYFMNDLSKFFTAICENTEMIAHAIEARLESTNGAYGNAELFTEECNYLKVCFGLCVRLFASYFAATAFNDDSKTALLRASLLALLERSVALEMSDKSCAHIAAAVYESWLRFEPVILDLSTAAHFYKLLLALQRHSVNECSSSPALTVSHTQTEITKLQTKKIRALCKKLLCRKWYGYDNTPAKGAACNCQLDELVKGFLKDSDFSRQQEILCIVHEEAGRLTGKDGAMRSFPNIRKANFPLLYRGLCETIINGLSSMLLSNKGSCMETGDQLQMWEDSCTLFNSLHDIVDVLGVPRNFQLFLKHSHTYLKLVLQHGLPVLEQCLRSDPERVSGFLRDLQKTTRFLHYLCVHSKALKKVAIVNQIPFLRETVEQIVFRVKALLAANKCSSVFWMGSLKNKDLHGDEVISQTLSSGRAGEDSSEEEEIPEDDVSVDETILEQSVFRVGGGGSDLSRSKSSTRSKCF